MKKNRLNRLEFLKTNRFSFGFISLKPKKKSEPKPKKTEKNRAKQKNRVKLKKPSQTEKN